VAAHTGRENLLGTYGRDGAPDKTPFYRELRSIVLEHRIELLGLDTVADLFGGNEIVRSQVNHFVKAVIGGLIESCRAAGWTLTMVLLAHPSLTGRNSGDGTSGSTAWSNAVRSRLYLEVPDEADPDTDMRILSRKKANYARAGEVVSLMWSDGVLQPSGSEPNGLPDRKVCEAMLADIGKAWAAGHAMSMAPQTKASGRYAVELLSKRFSVPAKVVSSLLNSWIADGIITVETYNQREKLKGLRVCGRLAEVDTWTSAEVR
jgi:hypothetical protein